MKRVFLGFVGMLMVANLAMASAAPSYNDNSRVQKRFSILLEKARQFYGLTTSEFYEIAYPKCNDLTREATFAFLENYSLEYYKTDGFIWGAEIEAITNMENNEYFSKFREELHECVKKYKKAK